MKKTLFTLLLFVAINCFGQVKSEEVNGLKITNNEIRVEGDTIINVIYKNNIETNNKPAYFINEKLVNESILTTINSNEIKSVNIEKSDVEIENVKYSGKIKITTKNKYKPKLISINNLKNKYVKTEKSEIIFKIDNEIINADYDKYIVDEKYILKLIVENYEKEKLKICFINIVTKSEENIKKSKEIIIRGNNEINLNK